MRFASDLCREQMGFIFIFPKYLVLSLKISGRRSAPINKVAIPPCFKRFDEILTHSAKFNCSRRLIFFPIFLE